MQELIDKIARAQRILDRVIANGLQEQIGVHTAHVESLKAELERYKEEHGLE